MQSGVGGTAPRAGEEIAAELIRRRLKINQDELEFCRMAAAFADCNRHEEFGSPSAITWISTNCQLTEVEAAMCIVIGRYLGASDARRTTAIRPVP